MEMNIAEEVAFVIGAGRGIGRAIAESFLQKGASVVATDIEEESVSWIEAAGQEAEAQGMASCCDVRWGESVQRGVAATPERFGGSDVLVNDAGVLGEGLIDEVDAATWTFVLDVNATGRSRTCKAVMPVMNRQGSGRILDAASFGAVVPGGSAGYAASKAAVVQFTRTLAGELGPWNITAHAYAPETIPNELNGFREKDRVTQDRLLDTLTLRRWGDAQEVCDLLCSPASGASRYVAGTLIDVSGGKLATQVPQRAYELAGRR